MLTSPVLIAGPLPPVPVRRVILDSVEALRLADQLLEKMRDDDSDVACYADADLRGEQAGCRVFAAILQEVVGDATPTVNDKAFATLKAYANRWPDSHPWAEAMALTGLLAVRSIDHAIKMLEESDGDEHESLLDVLYGAVPCVERVAGYNGDLPGLGGTPNSAGEVVDAILAGGELPPFRTAADVEAAYQSMRDLSGRQPKSS
jgi:hypothetical protein